jgi:hypothetical protein
MLPEGEGASAPDRYLNRRGEQENMSDKGGTNAEQNPHGSREPGIAGPLNVQVDPGHRDWRLYKFKWGDATLFANLVATRTSNASHQAGTEYWFVNKAALGGGSSVTVENLGDQDWGNDLPSAFANTQEFTAPTAGDWIEVTTDITGGTLYQCGDHFLRIGITGTGTSATISLLRWYKKSNDKPDPSFDPSGSYAQTSSLGTGSFWYADSK